MDQIKVNWISAGTGVGEIHIAHQGMLSNRELELISFATQNGFKHESLNETFWVISSRDKLDENRMSKIKRSIFRLV